MTYSHKRITDVFLILSIAIFLFGSGYKIAEWNIKRNARTQQTYTVFNSENIKAKDKEGKPLDFSLFWDTWNEVESKYIDKSKIDPQKMYYGAIKGMVGSVGDQYTFFLTPEEQKQSKDDLGGKFKGIGAQLGLKEGRIVVVAPIKDSPAERAGIQTGDYIVKVNGEDTAKWTLSQAVSKIRGEENTEVKLTIERDSKNKEIALTRQEIKVPSIEVSYQKVGDKSVAHLALSQFGDNTNAEWDNAIEEIAEKYRSGSVQGMVLDVRGNPGGYLESAVYIASEFLPRGKKVVTQESTNASDRVYAVRRSGNLTDIPLAVLINGGSASASEILAGALRDYDRATLVGEKSFGKGSVQEAVDLRDGAGLHVTISKWVLPKGDWINGKGIEPEFSVTQKLDEENTVTKETDAQLVKALEIVTSSTK